MPPLLPRLLLPLKNLIIKISLIEILLLVLIGKIAFGEIEWQAVAIILLYIICVNSNNYFQYLRDKAEVTNVDKLNKIEKELLQLNQALTFKNIGK